MINNIVVDITVPKAIGISEKLIMDVNSTILDAIKKLNQHILIEKIMKNSNEFNQFVLIYLDGKRVNDSSTHLEGNCSIDIIIPMAGG